MGEYEDFNDCVQSVIQDKGLSEEEAKKYCGKIKAQTEEKVSKWAFDLDIMKLSEADDKNIYIAGYASNGNKDHDDEYINMDSLKSVFNEYMENPVIKFMHDKAPQWRGSVGKVVPEYVDKDGKKWVTKFDDKPFLVIKLSNNSKLGWLRDMVKDGDLKGLSIGGKAAKKEGGTIYIKSWLETSLVDVPSAKGSFFSVLKSACSGGDCMIETEIEPEPVVKNCDAIKLLAFAYNNNDITTECVAKSFDWNKDHVNKVVSFINETCEDKIRLKTEKDKEIEKFLTKLSLIE